MTTGQGTGSRPERDPRIRMRAVAPTTSRPVAATALYQRRETMTSAIAAEKIRPAAFKRAWNDPMAIRTREALIGCHLSASAA